MRWIEPEHPVHPTAELAATEPPEQRGLARDEVRLLVAERGREVQHATFRDIAAFLRPGDLVVVNTSATRASAVDGLRADGRPVTVHVSPPRNPTAMTGWSSCARPAASPGSRTRTPASVLTCPAE